MIGIILVSALFAAAIVFSFFGWFKAGVETADELRPTEREWQKTLMQRTQMLLKRAGYLDMTPGFFFMMLGLITGFVALILIFLTKTLFVAAIAIPLVAFAAYLYLTFKERSYLKRASLEMVPFLNRMRASVGSGSSAQRAFLESMENTRLIKYALRNELQDIYLNRPMTEVLPETIEKLPLRSWEQFARQLTMAMERGGDLEEALGNSVGQINNLITLQAELRADYSRAAREQVVIMVLCGLILAALFLAMGELMHPLFTTWPGRAGLVFGVGLMLAGVAFGQKNVRDIERKLDF